MLKHASICWKIRWNHAEIFEKAGFPKAFWPFKSFSREVEEMIAHPIIRGVSLTGGEAWEEKLPAKLQGKFKNVFWN